MGRHKNNNALFLKDFADKIRIKVIRSSYLAKACHIGSALSAVDILVVLFKKILKKQDRFIFSKASGAAALYAILGKEKLLKQYPLPSKEAGLIWSSGSLGMGLSVAAGLALSDRSRIVYVLLSDGELQEGQVWEAVLFAAHHKLDNLVAVVDRNRLQALGNTEEILALEPLRDKFNAFNWISWVIDGHDIEALERVLKIAGESKGLPKVIIASTIKGKGVDFMEEDFRWHYKNLDYGGQKKAIFQLANKKSQKR